MTEQTDQMLVALLKAMEDENITVLLTPSVALDENQQGVMQFRASLTIPPLKRFLSDTSDGPSIKQLELSARAENALHSNGVFLMADLLKHSESDLMRMPNLGRISVLEIKEALFRMRMALRAPSRAT